MALRLTKWEWLLVATVACAVGLQLFVRPLVGLADNGDFPKVAGRFALWADPPEPNDRFIYFHSQYAFGKVWESHIPSSERGLVYAATLAHRLFPGGPSFDIRFTGAVHAILFLTAFVFLLPAIRKLCARLPFLLAAFIAFLFVDVSYVAYFNSFYSDAGALIFLILMLVSAIYLLVRASPVWIVGYAVCAALFTASKTQHSLTGPVWALFLGRIAYGATAGARRWLAGLLAGALAVFAAWFPFQTPVDFRASTIFNVIFFELTRQSPDPVRTLNELGLDDSYARYVGMNAFQPQSLTAKPDLAEQFYRKTGYSKILRFYAHHPAELARIYRMRLIDLAAIRVPFLGNFERREGIAPGTHSRSFAAWSDGKMWFLRRMAFLVPLAYAAAIPILLWRIGRNFQPAHPRALELALVVLAAAAIEFLTTTLGDVIESGRHFFIFHALTDIALCFALAAAIGSFTQRPRESPQPDAITS